MRGLVVTNPHGDLIMEGAKTLIVKDCPLEKDLGNTMLLLQGDLALAEIKLKSRERIEGEIFVARDEEHKISDNERRRWWKEKSLFWGFSFEIVKKYDPPQRVFKEKRLLNIVPNVIISDGEYRKTLKESFCKNVDSYKQEDLERVHTILHVFYERKAFGNRIVVEQEEKSIRQIIERHAIVVADMKVRKMYHAPPGDDLNKLSLPYEAIALLVQTGGENEQEE